MKLICLQRDQEDAFARRRQVIRIRSDGFVTSEFCIVTFKTRCAFLTTSIPGKVEDRSNQHIIPSNSNDVSELLRHLSTRREVTTSHLRQRCPYYQYLPLPRRKFSSTAGVILHRISLVARNLGLHQQQTSSNDKDGCSYWTAVIHLRRWQWSSFSYLDCRNCKHWRR